MAPPSRTIGGFRPSMTSLIIPVASFLAYQTGVHGAPQHQPLRHRHLQRDDDNSTVTREYEYVGCFNDKRHDRILGDKLTDKENTSPDFCYDYCAGLGALWMSTQWSIECWCGEEMELDYGRHGEAPSCEHPCKGDAEQVCGGFWAFDLYHIGPISSTPEGAFVDDIVKIIPVAGLTPGGKGWADSYSVGDECFMSTTFDHDIGDVVVDTPKGSMIIRDLFNEMGPGPGAEGRPLYNDIQCGNGPANDDIKGDEISCPGLVEYGREGCGQIGPMWNLSGLG